MYLSPAPACLSNKDKVDEKEKEKSLYVCTMKGNLITNNTAGRWLSSSSSLDMLSSSSDSNNSDQQVMSPPLKTMPPNGFCLGTVVALGSVIYHLGGCPDQTSNNDMSKKAKKKSKRIPRLANVFYFDTRRPDEGWKEAPSMLANRLEPAVYAVDGKIYVFGGCYAGNYPYAEFFDMEDWRPLPDLLVHLHYPYPVERTISPKVMPVHANDYGRKSRHVLLFHVRKDVGFLYSYDLFTEKMTQLDKNFGNWRYPLVAVGDLLYCCTGKGFSVYHLRHRNWFSKSILLPWPSPSQEVVVVGQPSFLLYIGNCKFCLIWYSNIGTQMLITCKVVTVTTPLVACAAGEEEEATTTTSLVATIESSTVYRLDGEHRLNYCLAL